MSTTAPTASGAAPAGGPDISSTTGPAPFLPPGHLDDRARRRHKIILALIIALGLAKGAYWVVLTQVWSPIDEAQHFGYVESLARGHGIPTVGRDLLSDDVMASMKAAADTNFRNEPFRPDASDEAWGSTRHQYEAIHGPTYYALMVPAYWVGAPFGTSGSLYAVRSATVLLAMVTVPLVWLLARRLFPEHPTIWLLAPAVLVTIDSASFANVGNDALVVVLGTASMVLLLRSLDDPRRLTAAAWVGVSVAATIVTKTTSLALIPLSILMVVAWLALRRPPWPVLTRWVGTVVVAAVATVAPWIAWNYWSYRAPSAAAQADALTGSINLPTERSLAGLLLHLQAARVSGFWASQLSVDGDYRKYWEWFATVAAVVGTVAALVRRRWRDLASLLWCASALPLAFVTMEALVWIVFGGKGGPTGRHLVVALGPISVMIAAASVLAFRERWGTGAVAGGLAGALVLAVPLQREVARRTYLTQVLPGNLAPVRTQTWSDGLVIPSAIDIDPGCPVEALGLGMPAPAPSQVAISVAGGSTMPATLDLTTTAPSRLASPVIPVYDLPEPVSDPLRVVLPAQTSINASGDDRVPWASIEGGPGDPVVVVYCRVDNPDQVAFRAVYPTLHPDWVSLGVLRGTPVVFAVLGVLGAGVAIGWAATGSVAALRERRSAQPDGPRPRSRS